MSQAYALSNQYELQNKEIYQAEVKSLFATDLEAYGKFGTYRWKNFDMLPAVLALQQYHPLGVPAAMYEACMNRSWRDRLPADTSGVSDTIAKMEAFCLEHEKWATSIKLREWYDEDASDKSDWEINEKCNARCKTFAGTMEAFYLGNKYNIFTEKPLNVLALPKSHLCEHCLNNYIFWQNQIEQGLWDLLPMWATGRSWGDLNQSMM